MCFKVYLGLLVAVLVIMCMVFFNVAIKTSAALVRSEVILERMAVEYAAYKLALENLREDRMELTEMVNDLADSENWET